MSSAMPSLTNGWEALPAPRVIHGRDQRIPASRPTSYVRHLEDLTDHQEHEIRDLKVKVEYLERQLTSARQAAERHRQEAARARQHAADVAASYAATFGRAKAGTARGTAFRRARAATVSTDPVEVMPGVIWLPDAWRLESATGAARLSPNEGALFRTLLAVRGETIMIPDLVVAIWGSDFPWQDSMHGLNVLMTRTRRKLRQIGADRILVSVHGIGCRLEVS